MAVTKEQIKEAKRILYSLLMQKDKKSTDISISGCTDNEIDIMYQLSIDEQIQEIFEANKHIK